MYIFTPMSHLQVYVRKVSSNTNFHQHRLCAAITFIVPQACFKDKNLKFQPRDYNNLIQPSTLRLIFSF